MPIAPAAATLIGAGISAAASGGNAYAQGRMNKKTRDWNEKQYHRTRADALKDWAMQNEYNHPSAQMQRFRDAGLNPNLIYGQSNTADAVRSSDTPSWNPRAPEVNLDGGQIMSQYFDAKMKTAQTDNVRAQTAVAIQDSALKAAQTANTAQQTAKSEFDLGLANDLRATSLEMARANLRQTTINTDLALRGADRSDRLAASSIQQAAQNIIESRSRTDNTRQSTENARETLQAIQKDNEIRELNLQLMRKGINPNDSVIMRIIGRAILDNNSRLKPFSEIKRSLIDALMKFIE